MATVKLVKTHEIIDMGSLYWQYQSGNTRFYTSGLQSTIKSLTTSVKCSIYSVGNTVSDNNTMQVSANGYIYTKDARYSDASLYKTALSGIYLVYELATPVEIPLSDTEQINAFVGSNNVWSDTGDSEVQYKLSIQEYVDRH